MYCAPTFILLALLFSVSTIASAEWDTKELLGGSVFIDIPKDLKLKVDTARKANLVNKSGLAKFSFNLTDTPADVKSMKAIHKVISEKYHQAYPKAKFTKDKTTNKFETKAFVIEFENKSVKSSVFQLIYGLPVNGKLLMVSFVSSEGKYKKKWKKIARSVFDTLETN